MKIYPWQQRILDAIRANQRVTIFMPRKAGRRTLQEALKDSKKVEMEERVYRIDGYTTIETWANGTFVGRTIYKGDRTLHICNLFICDYVSRSLSTTK